MYAKRPKSIFYVPEKLDIRNISTSVLEDYLVGHGEKPYRIRQVEEWVWKKSATDFDSMTNLSLETRDLLKRKFDFRPVRIDRKQDSVDGTVKLGFRLHDQHLVEGVLIPTPKRKTACISSQVGCSLSCKFCATGYLDRKRNLDAAEIYDQVVLLNQETLEEYGSGLTNIVFMGMGEPLLNYSNVLRAIHHLTSSDGLNISPKRITVSTAGVAKMIKKLGEDNPKVNLALSLHAADDAKRDTIMPINETNSLEALVDALDTYYSQTKSAITYEYILFKNFNDSIEDAKGLVKLARRIPSMVNLIEYNPIDNADFDRTSQDKADAFRDYLERNGINARIRRSRGKDIDAACGQLANKD